MDQATISGLANVVVCLGVFCVLFGVIHLVARERMRKYFSYRLLSIIPVACISFLWVTAKGVGIEVPVAYVVLMVILLVSFCLHIPALASQRHVLSRLTAHPFLQGLVMIGLGFGSMIGWASHQNAFVPDWKDSEENEALAGSPQMETGAARAFTDRGSEVTLLQPHDRREYSVSVEMEDNYQNATPLGERLLRVGPPDARSNCFGWVFTGGRYWVLSRDVETILRDNRYEEVQLPEPEDLIIYYQSNTNKALHAGIVRMVEEEGQILIESKFWKNGRFLHAPQDQVYSLTFRYYRTMRGSHELRLISSRNQLANTRDTKNARAN